MKTIQHDGESWKVLSTGAERDGKTYCHMASATRGRQQKNGFYPVQMCDWVPSSILAAAAGYTDVVGDGGMDPRN